MGDPLQVYDRERTPRTFSKVFGRPLKWDHPGDIPARRDDRGQGRDCHVGVLTMTTLRDWWRPIGEPVT